MPAQPRLAELVAQRQELGRGLGCPPQGARLGGRVDRAVQRPDACQGVVDAVGQVRHHPRRVRARAASVSADHDGVEVVAQDVGQERVVLRARASTSASSASARRRSWSGSNCSSIACSASSRAQRPGFASAVELDARSSAASRSWSTVAERAGEAAVVGQRRARRRGRRPPARPRAPPPAAGSRGTPARRPAAAPRRARSSGRSARPAPASGCGPSSSSAWANHANRLVGGQLRERLLARAARCSPAPCSARPAPSRPPSAVRARRRARPGSPPQRSSSASATRRCRRPRRVAPSVLVERVVDQGVGERERARALASARCSSAASTACSSSVDQLVLVLLDDAAEEVEVEVAADHGRAREHVSAVLASRSTRRPTTSRTLCGRPSSSSSPPQLPAAVRRLDERAGLREVAQHLADEERVAVGLGGDLARERRPPRPARARRRAP